MNYRGVDKAKQIVAHGVQKVSDMLSTNTFNMLLLLFVNILWFLPHLNNGLIMGDDIGEIACSNLSLMDAFTMGGAKYRPVYTFLCILITRCFHGNYQLYFALNIVVNTIVSVLVYHVIKRATKGRSFLSVIFALMFVISPFSYYNVLQVLGLMEGLCLLQLLLVFGFALSFWRGNKKSFIPAVLFAITLTLTHERYIVIAPWLLIVALCAKHDKKWARLIYMAAAMIPLLLNLFLKEIVFKAEFLTGTGGTSIDFNFASIYTFFTNGLKAIFGINNGPEYLFGYTFDMYPEWMKTTTTVFVIGSFVLLFVYILQNIILMKDKQKRYNELKLLLIAAAAIGALLITGCTTIRLEARWINAPFVAYLIYFAYIVSKIRFRYAKVTMNSVMLIMLVLISLPNMEQNKQIRRVYFCRAMYIGQNFYEATIGQYGESLADYHLYIMGNNELHWAVGTQNLSMFQVYLDESVTFDYVGSIEEVRAAYQASDRSKPIKIFRMEDNLLVTELGTETIDMNLVSSLKDYSYVVSPELPADTPSGTGVCTLNGLDMTVISGFASTVKNVALPQNSILYFNCSMPYDSSDGAYVSIKVINQGVTTELSAFDIYPGSEGKKMMMLHLNNAAETVADIVFEISSPSGDASADWVTFLDAGIYTKG